MVIAGFMAGGLGRTETITLSSTLGVVLFFVLLGVATFCYRLVAVNACLRHNNRLPAKRFQIKVTVAMLAVPVLPVQWKVPYVFTVTMHTQVSSLCIKFRNASIMVSYQICNSVRTSKKGEKWGTPIKRRRSRQTL